MRVAVVEDEKIVADRLIRLVGELIGDRLESIQHLSSAASARRVLESQSVDLLFLDLDLSGKDGFELLKDAVGRSFQTIIVSARHDQALRAFEFGVTDFVPKPYDRERLKQALARINVREKILKDQLRYLSVRRGRVLTLVSLEDIVLIKGADDYSEIHCQNDTHFLHSKTLSALEQVLPERFVRVHRSFIVDMGRVQSFHSETGSRTFLRLLSGQEVPVSRSRFKELMGRFG